MEKEKKSNKNLMIIIAILVIIILVSIFGNMALTIHKQENKIKNLENQNEKYLEIIDKLNED
jgi:flagellar basal body-associated protein FliL